MRSTWFEKKPFSTIYDLFRRIHLVFRRLSLGRKSCPKQSHCSIIIILHNNLSRKHRASVTGFNLNDFYPPSLPWPGENILGHIIRPQVDIEINPIERNYPRTYVRCESTEKFSGTNRQYIGHYNIVLLRLLRTFHRSLALRFNHSIAVR